MKFGIIFVLYAPVKANDNLAITSLFIAVSLPSNSNSLPADNNHSTLFIFCICSSLTNQPSLFLIWLVVLI